MVVYISVFTILMFLSFIELFSVYDKRIKRIVDVIVLIAVIVLSSLRNSKTGDFKNYNVLFNSINTHENFFSFLTDVRYASSEILYNALNYIIKGMGGSFRVFIIFEALFVNILLFYICKRILWNNYNKDYTITTFFIMWCLGFYNIFIIRQTLSIVICWISLKYIENRDIKKFLICVMIAICFHRSSLTWIVAYWIYGIDTEKKIKRLKYFLFLIAAAMTGYVLIIPLSNLLPGMWGYKVRIQLSAGLDVDYGLNYNYIFVMLKTNINILVNLAIIFMLYPLLKKDTLFKGITNLYEFGAMLVFTTSLIANQLPRLALSYSMISIFIYPYLFCNKMKRSNKLILYMVFGIYMLGRNILSIRSTQGLINGFPGIWSGA